MRQPNHILSPMYANAAWNACGTGEPALKARITRFVAVLNGDTQTRSQDLRGGADR